MQQLCNLGYQQKDCCCETQRLVAPLTGGVD